MKLLDWVRDHCATIDDNITLQVMRCRAIQAVLDKQMVMDALGKDDKDYAEWKKDRDDFFEAYDKIVARGKELDIKFTNERAYGLKINELAAFEQLNKKRD